MHNTAVWSIRYINISSHVYYKKQKNDAYSKFETIKQTIILFATRPPLIFLSRFFPKAQNLQKCKWSHTKPDHSLQDYNSMVKLVEDLAALRNDKIASTIAVQNHYAFALNRRNKDGDRDKALAVILKV